MHHGLHEHRQLAEEGVLNVNPPAPTPVRPFSHSDKCFEALTVWESNFFLALHGKLFDDAYALARTSLFIHVETHTGLVVCGIKMHNKLVCGLRGV